MQKLKIYFGHSKDLNYLEYYDKFEKNEKLSKYKIMLPHQKDENSYNGIAFYTKNNIDLFIAEVSYAATGLGIELGVSYISKIPIVCFYKKGTNPTSSLKSIATNFIEYENLDDFIGKALYIICNYENYKTNEFGTNNER